MSGENFEEQASHDSRNCFISCSRAIFDCLQERLPSLFPSKSSGRQQVRLVVEADVRNNGNLRPGAFARAEIVTNDAKMAVTVPSKAIVTFAGIEKVILVQNGKALEKPVTTGRRNGEWTEIVAGINVGDQVVVDPGNLQSGQAVEVVQ